MKYEPFFSNFNTFSVVEAENMTIPVVLSPHIDNPSKMNECISKFKNPNLSLISHL